MNSMNKKGVANQSQRIGGDGDGSCSSEGETD